MPITDRNERRMKIYTIQEIAQQAGVSVTTVSRVLNHRPDVNKQTREKVEKVMRACNFVGNANARGLKMPDGDVVYVILRGHASPFLTQVAETMLQYAENSKVPFLLEFIDEKADEFKTALRLMQEKRATAFIFVGSRIDARAKALAGHDIPMVFTTVNADGTMLDNAGSVQIDDHAMGYLAIRTLLEHNHRKIAIFGGAKDGADSLARRYAGAQAAFHDYGLKFDESRYIETRFSLKDAYDATRALFAVKGDTTAIFAMSDTTAIGVIRALNDMGKRVPEDVSVFGFDGIELGKYSIPRLTTIEQPVDELARASVELLLDLLNHNAPTRHITVDATLRMRDSVAMRACDNTL